MTASAPEQGQPADDSAVQSTGSTATLAERIDQLFRTVHPGRRKPYSIREVADEINAAAGEQVISHSYLWSLRKGVKTNPSMIQIAALAGFFKVSPVLLRRPCTAAPGPRDPARLVRHRCPRDRHARVRLARARAAGSDGDGRRGTGACRPPTRHRAPRQRNPRRRLSPPQHQPNASAWEGRTGMALPTERCLAGEIAVHVPAGTIPA